MELGGPSVVLSLVRRTLKLFRSVFGSCGDWTWTIGGCDLSVDFSVGSLFLRVLNRRNMPAPILSLRGVSGGGSIMAGEVGPLALAILVFFNVSTTSSSPCVRARGLDLPPVGFSPAIS
jgi:hypothetical protein